MVFAFSSTALLAGEDPAGACAQVGPLECRPNLRCGGGAKADDLRSELLRAEHRKAELMWEDMPESARWVSPLGSPVLYERSSKMILYFALCHLSFGSNNAFFL